MVCWDARTVVTNFQGGFRGTLPVDDDVNFPVRLDRLNGVEQQVEQRLPEQLFVRFDSQAVVNDLELDVLVLHVVVQRAYDIANERADGNGRAAHLSRA